MGSTPGTVSRRAFTIGAIGLLGGVSGCQSSGQGKGAPSGASGDAVTPSLSPVPTHSSDLRPLAEGVGVPPDLPETAPTIFRGVRLFDGEQVTEAADVLLAGGLVAAIGSALEAPADAEEVDGTGHTLIPGMIDAHVHSYEAFQQQSARFGVLTSLDMFTVPDLADLQQEERGTGATTRADLFSSMSLATAPDGHGTQFRVADLEPLTDASEAPSWVQARVEEGAAYIKIVVESGYGFTALDHDIVNALVDAAHDHQLRAVVHAQSAADLEVALASPIDGLAHVVWSEELHPDLVDRIARMGLFAVSTSGVGQPTKHKTVFDDDRVMDRMDPRLTAGFRRASYANEEEYAALLANLTALREAGVPLLAGTDAGNPGTTAGAGLLVEIENLVDSGMTPAEALSAATSVPADTFGLADRGRILEGLRGDVVLVEGDPTSDVLDLHGTVGVWKWGVPVDLSVPEGDPSRR